MKSLKQSTGYTDYSTFNRRSRRLLSFKSPILDALGPSSFAEFCAVRAPGKVLWCNFDLLRELGFDVPPTNQLTPAFNEQLLSTLSLRSVGANHTNGHEVVTLYADRYGGEGVSPALGAGRAGFLPHGNLYVKGLGFTPLFRHNDADDFVHSHGGVHLEDCLSEAIFGEVNHNLFTRGSNRIVAIIDQGLHVTEPSGRERHIALAVRTGGQLRPGHLLARRARGSRTPVEMFVSMTRATRQLVLDAAGVPDVSATMLRVLDDHAQTAADSFRWRMIHGALSPSNMDLSGAMLDLPTQSTQPRTAPIFKLDYAASVFGTEHKERGFNLAEMYRRVLRSADASTRERFNMKWINISNEMDSAYEKHLRVRLLGAAGLKTKLAQQICAEHPDLAAQFAKVVLELSALKNPGSACVARNVVEDLSVVDVFNLLHTAPRAYFATRGLTVENVIAELKAVYKGNRYHVAKRRETVAALALQFMKLYHELIQVCRLHAGDYYDDEEAMRSSIIARTAFENEPLDALYTYTLYERLNTAIAKYKATNNTDLLTDLIDGLVARSLRSVDGLLAQGTSRLVEDGSIEVQRRTIRGTTYSVRARNDRAQTRYLHINGLDLSVPGLIGRLASGYAFAIPDRHELNQYLSAHIRGKN